MRHTTPDGNLTIWSDADGYHIQHNPTRRIEDVPVEDINTLFIHPTLFDEESACMTDNPHWLQPGEAIFDLRLAQDIDHRPSDYYQHFFGMMKGMGLRHMVSLAELDAIFE